MDNQLLNAIRDRGRKQVAFGYGITTADKYLLPIQESIGLDGCNRFLARGCRSFHDVLQKASRTLVYSNPEMVVEEKKLTGVLKDVELPKNTLMVFKHVLTSSNKDRDDDVLHSDGAAVDPKMLLLWQHVHTMPIGKYLATVTQNKKRLLVASCIVDVNALCHDAAVMIDNGMGRFSHGFRALDFTESEDKDSYGYDITSFEIMEESLVSVPANADAETEEVLLSLVEDQKLTSALMKRVGRGIRERRDVSVPGISIKYRERLNDNERELTCGSLADLKEAADTGLIGGMKDEDEPRDRIEAKQEDCGTGTPEKADVAEDQVDRKEGTGNEEVKDLPVNEDTASNSVVEPELKAAKTIDAEQAMALFLVKATTEQRQRMVEAATAITNRNQPDLVADQYRALIGK